MWVWLDRAGPILFDATLSTALFLSLVVLAMLVCRQPTRRLLIARVALLASLAMIPLVALVPLPRLDLLDTLVQADLLPNSLILELEKTGRPRPVSIVPEHEAHSLLAHDLHDKLLGTGRWLPRSSDIDRSGVCGDGNRLAAAGVLGGALADPPFTTAVGRGRGDLRPAFR